MHLRTLGATLVGDRLYFVSSDFNGLFFMDLKKKQIVYKTYFEKYVKYENGMFGKQILHRDKIFFIPYYCNKIAIYDLKTEKIEYIEVIDKGKGPIRDAFIDGSYLWMLYARYPANVFKVNLTTKKYEVVSIDWNIISAQIGYSEQTMTESERSSTFASAKQVGNNWWMFTEMHGYLLSYDWRRNKIRPQSFKYFKDKRIVGEVQEKVWMMARDEDKVLEYDFQNGTEKWLQLQELNQISGDIMRIIEKGKYLLFIKKTGMVVLEKENCSVQCFKFSEEKNLMSYVIYDGKMILLPAQGTGLAVFYLSEGRVEEYAFEWEEELTNESLEKYFSGCISEDVCELQEFIKLKSKKKLDNREESGVLIWNALFEK